MRILCRRYLRNSQGHSIARPVWERARCITDLTQSPTPPPGGMNQVIEPCYSWNNIKENGVHYNLSSSFGTIRAGEHYFNDTAKPGYTPFTYPHPLTKGLSLPQQTTSNATGNSQHNQPKERRPWGGKKRREKKQKKAKKKTDQ